RATRCPLRSRRHCRKRRKKPRKRSDSRSNFRSRRDPRRFKRTARPRLAGDVPAFRKRGPGRTAPRTDWEGRRPISTGVSKRARDARVRRRGGQISRRDLQEEISLAGKTVAESARVVRAIANGWKEDRARFFRQ